MGGVVGTNKSLEEYPKKSIEKIRLGRGSGCTNPGPMKRAGLSPEQNIFFNLGPVPSAV